VTFDFRMRYDVRAFYVASAWLAACQLAVFLEPRLAWPSSIKLVLASTLLVVPILSILLMPVLIYRSRFQLRFEMPWKSHDRGQYVIIAAMCAYYLLSHSPLGAAAWGAKVLNNHVWIPLLGTVCLAALAVGPGRLERRAPPTP
jgi:hypothetical protein